MTPKFHTTTITRPISNTERRKRLLMGMIGADECMSEEEEEDGDDYETHMKFETRKELFI